MTLRGTRNARDANVGEDSMMIISKDFIFKLILSLFLITPSFSDSDIPKDPYKGEGAFVEGPARVGTTMCHEELIAELKHDGLI